MQIFFLIYLLRFENFSRRKFTVQFTACIFFFFNVKWKQASEIIPLLLTATSVKP